MDNVIEHRILFYNQSKCVKIKMFFQSDCETYQAGSSVLLSATIQMRFRNTIITAYAVFFLYFPYTLLQNHLPNIKPFEGSMGKTI